MADLIKLTNLLDEAKCYEVALVHKSGFGCRLGWV